MPEGWNPAKGIATGGAIGGIGGAAGVGTAGMVGNPAAVLDDVGLHQHFAEVVIRRRVARIEVNAGDCRACHTRKIETMLPVGSLTIARLWMTAESG